MHRLGASNVAVTTDNPRGGVDLHFAAAGEACQQSPVWTTGGRSLRFVRLAAGHSLALDPGTHYLKVILGRAANLDRGCLAAPFAVRSTAVDEPRIDASDEPLLFALMTMQPQAPERIDHMLQVAFSGPQAERLTWQRFDEKFAGVIDYFDGMDCYMANGFHLLDERGQEIVYVNPWTCGKGVDLSTHNHGHPPSAHAPAFAEVHWVLAAATPSSGMYRTPEPGAQERTRYPMRLGDEHGPFYAFDAAGKPIIEDNGAVRYPWHGWQGGDDGDPAPAYDFVLAFEIDPALIASAGPEGIDG